jgi:hypothetical protein
MYKMIILEAENGLGFGAEKHQQIMHELLGARNRELHYMFKI